MLGVWGGGCDLQREVKLERKGVWVIGEGEGGNRGRGGGGD